MQTAAPSKADKPSLLNRIRNFFQRGSATTKAKGDTQAEDSVNYDKLDDPVNLKSLIEMDKDRNKNFEKKVLNDAEFLNEARELAKRNIPESTVKAMKGKAEFDEILTGAAKNVERRVNNAIVFKPTEEEFTSIQNEVKRLPKSAQTNDVTANAEAISEALASTSVTIQNTPNLKNQLKGTIETFLKESKDQDLTLDMVERLNKGLRAEEPENRETYKTDALTKGKAVFSGPRASRIQLEQTIDFINNAKKQGVNPSVVAGLAYQRLIAYHPFAEGNGRMTRVIVNKLLLDAGYPIFTKFDDDFETRIIPQTKRTAQTATSAQVVEEFLRTLNRKNTTDETSPAPNAAVPDI